MVPDWAALAEVIVDRALRVRRGERVVIQSDPLVHGDLFEAVRARILRAGACEHAFLPYWSAGLVEARRAGSRGRDHADVQRLARLDVMRGADVFILLPRDEAVAGSVAGGEMEWVLGRWRGRGVHFHWSPDHGAPGPSEVNDQLFASYERSVLDLDYGRHASSLRRLARRVRGQWMRITSPAGTDLRFRLDPAGWYHLNDGDASQRKARIASCARDREEELPCGTLRFIPIPSSVSGTISLRGAWRPIASIPLDAFSDDLDVVFADGRVVALRTGAGQAELDAEWARQTGDRDRLAEVIIGTNPVLTTPVGARVPAYWGADAGSVRLRLGDNAESGGALRSSLSASLFVESATVSVDGSPVIEQGRLLDD